jgi:hypothetical protein
MPSISGSDVGCLCQADEIDNLRNKFAFIFILLNSLPCITAEKTVIHAIGFPPKIKNKNKKIFLMQHFHTSCGMLGCWGTRHNVGLTNL